MIVITLDYHPVEKVNLTPDEQYLLDLAEKDGRVRFDTLFSEFLPKVGIIRFNDARVFWWWLCVGDHILRFEIDKRARLWKLIRRLI